MKIKRTTSGLIENQFVYLDELSEDEEAPLIKRARAASQLTNTIARVSSLELQHRRANARLAGGAEPGPVDLVHKKRKKRK